MTALTWVIVGVGALFVLAAAYWRLTEREEIRRGADAFRFRFFRVWFPLVIGIAALGQVPQAMSAPFPVVALLEVLSLAPAVIVVVLGQAAAKRSGPGARTTTAPDGAGNNGESG
ncbi:hypothetical protein OHN99_15020 [Streptomyces jietaisiensis]|uniref:hypothetical protein n=1 Tax=Streptomyces griseoaurantiacus TaxID=68213 RepID=UPI002E2DFD6D|nr:hypothetical protein [Streptomyces jietaisiensis]